jgi:hypothetical protein
MAVDVDPDRQADFDALVGPWLPDLSPARLGYKVIRDRETGD